MKIDLSFVNTEMHLRLLREELIRARRDEEVSGLMLLGSVARGSAYPGSDLDLFFLLRDGCHRAFHSEMRIKLRAALDAGDEFKAAYGVTTTAWFILEALWAVNEKPSPPGGAALAFMRDLPRQPPDFDDWLRRFVAGDAPARIEAALEAIDWMLPLLENVTS